MVCSSVRVPAFFTALLIPAFASYCGAQECNEQQFIASNAAEDHDLGIRVSVSGSVAVFGASAWPDLGYALVMRRDVDTGVWGEEQILVALDGTPEDRFGEAVDTSNDVVIVGARFHGVGGAAYVFRCVGGVWVLEQKLVAPDAQPGDWFGAAVAVSGDYAIVGAFGDDLFWQNSGSASVFRYEPAAGIWVFEDKITAEGAAIAELFGSSVDLDGEVAIIGRTFPQTGVSSTLGYARIYRRSPATGTWLEEGLLTSGGISAAMFGHSVSISGDLAIAGTWGTSGVTPGFARIYRYFAASGTWEFEQHLEDPAFTGIHGVGHSVAIDGDLAVVGAAPGFSGEDPGFAIVFRYDHATAIWRNERTLERTGEQGYDGFARGMSIDGKVVAVGVPFSDFPEDSAGSGVFYDLTDCLPSSEFRRGDANGDGLFNLADSGWIASSLFLGGPELCLDAQDSNDDGAVDIADVIHTLSYLFVGGPAPPPPVFVCGEDPTPDSIDDYCPAYPCP